MVAHTEVHLAEEDTSQDVNQGHDSTGYMYVYLPVSDPGY